ncbi:MAG TPA: hypothetical protein PLP27_10360 [Crocinitomicaceae bacterium]|nr:hypothetical protein [Crocinitomicaceae bacterium]
MKRTIQIQSLNTKKTTQKKNKFDEALIKLGVSEKKNALGTTNKSKKSLKTV